VLPTGNIESEAGLLDTFKGATPPDAVGAG